MSTTPTYSRKSVSLDADVAQMAEQLAKSEGRSLSNMINWLLRQRMASATTKNGLRARKGERE